MAICPNCEGEITEDFGLATCASCGEVLFIEMDGSARRTTGEVEDPPAAGVEVELNDTKPEMLVAESPPEEYEEAVVEEESNLFGSQEPSYEEAPEEKPLAEATVPTSSLGEVAEFANSELSKATSGQYLYTLNISGIDSKEIRDSLASAFTDDKFKWNVPELMNSVDRGELVLPDLNPVKAFVLINKIKFLPIEIHWEQNDITV